MTTAGDIVKGSLRLIGQLAESEEPSSATMQDCLVIFDELIESLDTEKLSVFSTQDQIFTWPSNEITRTLGPSGNFVGDRPVLVEDSTYYILPGTGQSYTVDLVNEDQYNSIGLKGTTSTLPFLLWVNMDYPNITMKVFPKPTQALEWHIISRKILNQVENVSTEILFPPGYKRMFRFNLACEIASEFGIEPSIQVQKIAIKSKNNLKRINNPNDIMSMAYPLVVKNNRFNIYSGGF